MRAEYVLLQPRTINGVPRPIGHTFTTTEQHGDDLVKDGIAERVTPRAALLRPAVIAPKTNAIQSRQRRMPCCGRG